MNKKRGIFEVIIFANFQTAARGIMAMSFRKYAGRMARPVTVSILIDGLSSWLT
jgi:hypothetical protein